MFDIAHFITPTFDMYTNKTIIVLTEMKRMKTKG